jgi:hypothetical protein
MSYSIPPRRLFLSRAHRQRSLLFREVAMQYALVHQDAPDLTRIDVAQALRRRDQATSQRYVERGDIVDADHANPADEVFCIYCGRPLFVTAARDPSRPRPDGTRHFEHQQRGDVAPDCAGRVLTAIGHAENEAVAVSWLDAIPLEGRRCGVYANPDF